MSLPDRCDPPETSDTIDVPSPTSVSSHGVALPASGPIVAPPPPPPPAPVPAIAEPEVTRAKPKRAPNSFILYKNDLRKRCPEIYELDLGPDQLLRVIARMWENESTELRTVYEERYMKLLEALEVKPELTDMGARRSRTRNVTTARRAKCAVKGKKLAHRSDFVLQKWIMGLRGSALKAAVADYDKEHPPS